MTVKHDCNCADRTRGVFLARVVANQMICREHYRLTLSLPSFPAALPGQFVHVRCTEPNELGWTGGAFIRRPFSIGGLRRSEDEVQIDILHRAIGIGTKWLARLQPGDAVNIAGPLGQPFHMPAWDRHLAGPDVLEIDRLEAGPTPAKADPTPVKASPTPAKADPAQNGPLALLVGGGIGLPPLIWLAEKLRAAGIPAIALCGARSADLLPLSRDPAVACTTDQPTLFCRELAELDVPGIVSTDDGSLGAHGLLPHVLADWLEHNPNQARSAVVYTCGPDRMMKAVAAVSEKHNLPCQVCLERMMACGMGTCQSCVVRIRDTASAEGWRYKLCCTDGPVFDARDVVWG